MPKLEILHPTSAPQPIGPFSPMVQVGEMIYGSAIGAIDPKTSLVVGETVYDQAIYTLKLISAMLRDCGSSLDHVVNVTVFLKDMTEYAELNRAYIECFGEHRPARSVVSVIDLPKSGVFLTINFVAVRAEA